MAWPSPVWMRQPTTSPQASITASPNMLSANDDTAWPIRTEERAMGSERKRSMTPLDMSLTISDMMDIDANTMLWAKMPGIRNAR